MTSPEGEPAEREKGILDAAGLTPANFNLAGGLRMEGERRPLRVPLEGPELSCEEEDLVLRFSLPRGSYATAVLREVMKRPGNGA